MIEFIIQNLQGAMSGLFTSIGFIPAALGFYIALRCLRFPDLTVEGAFVLGQVLSAVIVSSNAPPFLALILAIVAGSICGMITAWQNIYLRISPFICGIVTTFFITSFNYKLMKIAAYSQDPKTYQSNGEPATLTLSTSGIFEKAYNADILNTSLWGELRIYQFLALLLAVLILAAITFILLRSKIGLRLRAFGVHNLSGQVYTSKANMSLFFGLCFTNALVCLSGALCAQAYRLASIENGASILIPLLAAVVVGEFVVNVTPLFWNALRHYLGKPPKIILPLLSRPLGLAIAPVFGYIIYNMVFVSIAAVILPEISDNVAKSISTQHKYWITAVMILALLLYSKNKQFNNFEKDII